MSDGPICRSVLAGFLSAVAAEQYAIAVHAAE